MATEPPPDWLEIERGENRAFIALRSADEPVADWGELIAEAQYVIGRAREPINDSFDHLLGTEEAADLIAASRILDNAAQARETEPLVPEDGVPPTDNAQIGPLHLLAAVAYAMHGNFCSAKAVINRQLPDFRLITPVQAAIVVTCAPDLIGKALDGLRSASLPSNPVGKDVNGRIRQDDGTNDQPSAIRRYLETFEAFLLTGEDQYGGKLRDLYQGCFSADWSSFDMALWGACEVALVQANRLSTAKNLIESKLACAPKYISALTRTGVRTLFPPQWRTVASGALIDPKRKNCLISLPTSAGKTLLAEFSLVASVLASGPAALGCYIVPYVALGTQVAKKLKRHVGDLMKIHQAFGNHPLNEGVGGNISGIIVATPERFDSILRDRPELLDRLTCVVFDEVHLIERGTRGVRLEGLITRLRLHQEFGSKAEGSATFSTQLRLVLISAVLERYEGIIEWLGGSEKAVLITDSWKPTAQRVAIWKEEGKLNWHIGAERVGSRGLPARTVVGSVRLPWPEKDFRPVQYPNQARPQLARAYANVAFLVEYLLGAFPRQAVLCVCATRESTRLLAAELANRLPEIEVPGEHVARALKLIETKHPFLRPLARFLRRGVAFHNSSVPHDVRELIEEAVLTEQILAVSSTTTLAEGVDLPFRLTVVADWLHYGELGMRPMSSSLFRNIAGRSGRAGIFTEGDTVVFDNPVGDANYVHPLYRSRDQEKIFFGSGGESENLSSAIGRAVGSEALTELHAGLESQFMAAIAENPYVEDMDLAFPAYTYAQFAYRNQNADGGRLAGWFQQATDVLLNDEYENAFASRNSPLKLTELGRVANKTTFSPSSCRDIINWLKRANVAQEGEATLAACLLKDLGHLPEQPSSKFKSVLLDPLSKAAKRYCIHPEYLGLITEAWLAGVDIEKIFASLPNIRSSSRKPKIEEWINGRTPALNWDAEFDKFADFIHTVLLNFLPWLLAACGMLSKHLDETGIEVDWEALAKRFEDKERSSGEVK